MHHAIAAGMTVALAIVAALTLVALMGGEHVARWSMLRTLRVVEETLVKERCGNRKLPAAPVQFIMLRRALEVGGD